MAGESTLQDAAAAGASAAHEETVMGGGHAHPSDRSYVGIALILAVITGAEVGVYYLDLGNALVAILLVLMVVKFTMVAGWFMHLRFDSNLFTRLFVGGLFLAVFVYAAALSTFQFFASR